MTDFTYSVTFDPLGTSVDITEGVERLEWIEIGTGELRSLSMRLNSQFGQFITEDNAGTTPILDQFDQVRLNVTDRDGKVFDTIYEVDILRPINDTQMGTVLEVEMLAREYHTSKVMFSKPFFFENAFNVTRDIIDFYNDPDSKGTLQSDVEGGDITTTNTLPEWTANEFRFDLHEQSAYDGLLQVVDRMGSSVAAGGGGDFWELAFVDNIIQTITVNMFISGNPPRQQTDGVFDPALAVTIIDTLAVNPAEEEGGIESTRGTVVGSWGANSFGSLPVQFFDFQGANEAFALYTFWDDTLPYPTDVIVMLPEANADGDRRHFQASQDVPINTEPSTNPAFWNEITFQNYLTSFGIDPIYSLWTNNKDTAWRASGGNPSGALAGLNPSFTTAACWDSNLIIQDSNGSRTFADIRAISTASVPSQYKYSGTDLYRGFRILVDLELGSAGIPFNQNGGLDRFGKPFDNNVAKHNGAQFSGTSEWRNWDVFRELEDFQMIAVDHEARVYQKINGVNPASLDAWVSGIFYFPDTRVSDAGVAYQCEKIHTSTEANRPPNFRWRTLPSLGTDTLTDISEGEELFNDCYHPVNSIDLDPAGGWFQKPNTGGITNNFGVDSAVRYTWTFEITDYVQDFNDKPKYYRVGAWADFKFPFAPNSYQGDTIGTLYGNNLTKKEPVTLDTSNMHFNHNGEIGFNNVDARDLGNLESLVTYQKFRYKAGFDDDSTGLFLQGNYPCRCTCYDTSDNVVTQDYTIPFNDRWASIVLPLNEFQIYRARTPAKWGQITQAFVKRVEILNVFEWKNLKKICFQWLKPYDEQGRFHPQIENPLEQVIRIDSVGVPVNGRIDWSFDGFYFAKNDLALTSPNTERAIMPRFFDEPLISNHISLVQSNEAKLEITGFRHKQYDITTEGTFDIDFADSFFLENKFLVNESDNGANTIKLVAKKITYTIDKQPQGPGGFLRAITGVKRFE